MKIIGSLLKIGYTILAMYGLGLMVWWSVDSSPVISFQPGIIAPARILPGEIATIYQPITKQRDCYGRVYRYLIGDCGLHPLMESEAVLSEGFNGSVNISFEVPLDAGLGNCEFRARHRYWCNPFDGLLNRQTFDMPPIIFEIASDAR